MAKLNTKCKLYVKPSDEFIKHRGYEDLDKTINDLSTTVTTDFSGHSIFNNICFQLCYMEMISYASIKNAYLRIFESSNDFTKQVEKLEIINIYIENIYRPFVNYVLNEIFGSNWEIIYALLVKELEPHEPSDINFEKVLQKILINDLESKQKFNNFIRYRLDKKITFASYSLINKD